jgi:formylglycine-generating enzyme
MQEKGYSIRMSIENMKIRLIFSIILTLMIAQCLVCKNNEIDIDWVKIPSGAFYMGTPEELGKKLPSGYCWKDETPAREVYLDGFYISKCEITYGQYLVFCKDSKVRKPKYYENGMDDYPVTDVSWDDAHEFCKWLSLKTGANITLPTEAQWEKACRGGTIGDSYVHKSSKWNHDEYPEDYSPTQLLIKTAWIIYNSGRDFHPVGQLEPNPYGLYDMLGNVSEWCLDVYDEGFYKKSPKKNPVCLEGDKKIRVLRGGGFTIDNFQARCGVRFKLDRNARVGNIGFRIVKNIVVTCDSSKIEQGEKSVSLDKNKK